MTFEDTADIAELENDDAAGAATPTASEQPIKARKVGTFDNEPRSALNGYLDNPHQRYTEGRSGTAANRHLAILQPPHLEFDVARCIEDGQNYLINGHTRRDVWNRSLQADLTQIPETVNLTTWECDTLDDVVALYKMFDASEAVKNTGDQIFGCMRELGIMPTSPQLTKSGWLDGGLRLIRGLSHGEFVTTRKQDFSVMAALDEAREEIELLDSLQFGGKHQYEDAKGKSKVKVYPRLTPHEATFALFALMRDGVAAVPFLEAVRDRHGAEHAKDMDAIYAFWSWPKSAAYQSYKAVPGRKGPQMTMATWEVMTGAYEAWLADNDAVLTKYPHGTRADERRVLNFHPFAKRT